MLKEEEVEKIKTTKRRSIVVMQSPPNSKKGKGAG
jgi:hypothetical protein